MNRYLVFAGQIYYSVGGGCDFLASKDNLDDAIELAQGVIGKNLETFDKKQYFDEDKQGVISIEWSHIFDIKKEKIIKEFGKTPLGREAEIIKNSF